MWTVAKAKLLFHSPIHLHPHTSMEVSYFDSNVLA